MSQIVTSALGRFRRVLGAKQSWLWECRCGTWCNLSMDQWAGNVSVNHDAQECPAHYHETHNFGAALLAAVQSRLLTGLPLVEEET
jgi:hypothetical protein